jgi:hypothetical protein
VVYGAFAAVPIFLLWIYLSWLIIIGGAVLVAVLPEWRERAGQSQPVPGSDFFDALQILKILQLRPELRGSPPAVRAGYSQLLAHARQTMFG